MASTVSLWMQQQQDEEQMFFKLGFVCYFGCALPDVFVYKGFVKINHFLDCKNLHGTGYTWEWGKREAIYVMLW